MTPATSRTRSDTSCWKARAAAPLHSQLPGKKLYPIIARPFWRAGAQGDFPTIGSSPSSIHISGREQSAASLWRCRYESGAHTRHAVVARHAHTARLTHTLASWLGCAAVHVLHCQWRVYSRGTRWEDRQLGRHASGGGATGACALLRVACEADS